MGSAVTLAVTKMADKPGLFKIKSLELPENPAYVFRAIDEYQREAKALAEHVDQSLAEARAAGVDACQFGIGLANRPGRHDKTVTKNIQFCKEVVTDSISRMSFCTVNKLQENGVVYPLSDKAVAALKEKARNSRRK